jgi:Zn-dependent peptidase ImmA (M78 family)
MHGMTAMFKGRPVIVLSKNVKHPAWLLFILAHELGHVARGHLREGEVLLDQDVGKNVPDSEEEEANSFAIETLTGDPKFRVYAPGRWPKAVELAASAQAISKKDRIDPGHIVLNYAATMGDDFWPVANAALKNLGSEGNGPSLVRQVMADRLDWSELPKESSQFLMRVTRAES